MKGLASALVAAAVMVASAGSPARAQSPAGAGAAAPRIGIVDLTRVRARSAAGVAAREQLERDRASMQREIDAKRQELEKLDDELQKKGPLMTADARREKQDVFERKRRDAARLADDFRRELEKKEQMLSQKVLQELAGIIDRLGKERGYFLIVERRGAGVLYSSGEADVTDEVIRAYDQETGSRGKK